MNVPNSPMLPLDQSGSTEAHPDDERAWARSHIVRRRKLRADLVAYVVINAFLVALWGFTGAGYFWPAWVMLGWGVLLTLDIWNLGQHRPITQADIDRELDARR